MIVYWQCAIVKFVRPGKVGSTIGEEQNDGDGRGGRSVTGVHGSGTGIQNKTVNGGVETRIRTKV